MKWTALISSTILSVSMTQVHKMCGSETEVRMKAALVCCQVLVAVNGLQSR